MSIEKRKKKHQKEKTLPEMTDDEIIKLGNTYMVEKLGWEISQARRAFELSKKNQKQSDGWII